MTVSRVVTMASGNGDHRIAKVIEAVTVTRVATVTEQRRRRCRRAVVTISRAAKVTELVADTEPVTDTKV